MASPCIDFIRKGLIMKMSKRSVVFVMLVAVMCSLIGCGAPPESNPQDVQSTGSDIEFWTDAETGVQYVVYDRRSGSGGMGGITPRLNADGTLYVVY